MSEEKRIRGASAALKPDWSEEEWDFGTCKLCYAPAGRPKYRLRDTVVRECGVCGAHYIDYFDPPLVYDDDPAGEEPTEHERAYFRDDQEHSRERLDVHVALAERYAGGLEGRRVLDIGSGGGWFLATLRDRGATVCGIELYKSAIRYSRVTYDLDIVTSNVQSDEVQGRFRESFDIVTLWDVIEHVNFPRETIEAASSLLKPGGYLMVGTPCRDAFYHRMGELTYRLSRGRYPTLLNVMYSSQPYSHKQILSTGDLDRLFAQSGIDTVETKVIMELSLPCDRYLAKIFRSRALARTLAPAVKPLLHLFPIRNKVITVGRKRTD